MPIDPGVMLVAAVAVFLIAFMKGAFGGGFAILGIPLLSLVTDPLTAGALLAPLFVVMDLFALRYWKPSTWSRQDLRPLIPALVVGIVIGYLVLRALDQRAISILIALVTLGFAALWFRGGGKISEKPRSLLAAMTAGAASGITTMVAHAGGPPLAMYLLPRGLPKALYAGTTSIFFTIGNILKAGPWLSLAKPSPALWATGAVCLAVVPFGVWAGWALHQRIDQQQLYKACYGLLVVSALKLLYDGLSGYVASG